MLSSFFNLTQGLKIFSYMSERIGIYFLYIRIFLVRNGKQSCKYAVILTVASNYVTLKVFVLS